MASNVRRVEVAPYVPPPEAATATTPYVPPHAWELHNLLCTPCSVAPRVEPPTPALPLMAAAAAVRPPSATEAAPAACTRARRLPTHRGSREGVRHGGGSVPGSCTPSHFILAVGAGAGGGALQSILPLFNAYVGACDAARATDACVLDGSCTAYVRDVLLPACQRADWSSNRTLCRNAHVNPAIHGLHWAWNSTWYAHVTSYEAALAAYTDAARTQAWSPAPAPTLAAIPRWALLLTAAYVATTVNDDLAYLTQAYARLTPSRARTVQYCMDLLALALTAGAALENVHHLLLRARARVEADAATPASSHADSRASPAHPSASAPDTAPDALNDVVVHECSADASHKAAAATRDAVPVAFDVPHAQPLAPLPSPPTPPASATTLPAHMLRTSLDTSMQLMSLDDMDVSFQLASMDADTAAAALAVSGGASSVAPAPAVHGQPTPTAAVTRIPPATKQSVESHVAPIPASSVPVHAPQQNANSTWLAVEQHVQALTASICSQISHLVGLACVRLLDAEQIARLHAAISQHGTIMCCGDVLVPLGDAGEDSSESCSDAIAPSHAAAAERVAADATHAFMTTMGVASTPCTMRNWQLCSVLDVGVCHRAGCGSAAATDDANYGTHVSTPVAAAPDALDCPSGGVSAHNSMHDMRLHANMPPLVLRTTMLLWPDISPFGSNLHASLLSHVTTRVHAGFDYGGHPDGDTPPTPASADTSAAFLNDVSVWERLLVRQVGGFPILVLTRAEWEFALECRQESSRWEWPPLSAAGCEAAAVLQQAMQRRGLALTAAS